MAFTVGEKIIYGPTNQYKGVVVRGPYSSDHLEDPYYDIKWDNTGHTIKGYRESQLRSLEVKPRVWV